MSIKNALGWSLIPVLLAAFFGIAGCTPRSKISDDPKVRLNEYISKSFAVRGSADRNDLMDYLTGDARKRLKNWSDDQFRQAFIDSKRQFLKLSFREIKPVSLTQSDITYEITYLSQNKDTGHDAKITNRKLAEMVLDQGKWMITDVRNLKELVEYTNELTLP
jgi:hypothetical protein